MATANSRTGMASTMARAEKIKSRLSPRLFACLVDTLKNDPRPSYIDTPSRVFGFFFDKYEVKFTVSNKALTVISLDEVNS